jgi:hypothetical protein
LENICCGYSTLLSRDAWNKIKERKLKPIDANPKTNQK